MTPLWTHAEPLDLVVLTLAGGFVLLIVVETIRARSMAWRVRAFVWLCEFMRRHQLVLVVLAVVSCSVVVVAQSTRQTQRITMDWGYVDFVGNEVIIRSTVDDPPKVRLESAGATSLGGLSFGRVRPDGRAEEMVLIQGKQDERRRGCQQDYSGEMLIHVRDGNAPGDGMKLVMRARHDGIWLVGDAPFGGDPRPCER